MERAASPGRALLVFGDARLDQIRHERGGERLVGWEADAALAEVVALELGSVGAYQAGAHDVEGAVVLERGEAHEEAVVLVGGDLVADDLGGPRRGGLDGLAELVERGPRIFRHGREIIVNARRWGAPLHLHQSTK